MTLEEIRGRLLTRIELADDDARARSAASSAINEGQRLFAFLTLSQETTREFVLTPGVSFYRMLNEGWSDWIAPLRVRLSNDTATGQDAKFDAVEGNTAMFGEQQYAGLTTTAKPKLRPATLYQMAAINDSWMTATGTPSRYGCLGWDLLFLDKKPVQSGQKLLITFARSCAPLVNDSDAPEIHDADHEVLIDYGEFRMRANEGGQELAGAMPKLKNFLEAARQRADQVRARSIAMGYDHLPYEWSAADISRLVGPGKVKKEGRWTGQA